MCVLFSIPVFIVATLTLLALYCLRHVKYSIPSNCTNNSFNPSLSILKPLLGEIPGLRENLESFFTQNYENYEIIFCLRSEKDPALKIAREVIAEHPDVRSLLVIGDGKYGFNPKVNNLMSGYEKISSELVLISDADVFVDKDYLRKLTSYFENPSVGLVSNLIRCEGGNSLGALLENLYLNSFIALGISALYVLFRHPCVIGKSMIFRKRDFDRFGGFDYLKNYLAEDYLTGMAFKKMGREVILSGIAVGSNTSNRTLKVFFNRNLRWTIMRFKMIGVGFLLDLLINPLFFAIAYLTLCFGKTSLSVFAGVLIFKTFVDVSAGILLGTRRNLSSCILSPIKDFIVTLIWFVPFFKDTAEWGGRRFKIKSKTEIFPID